MRGIKTLFLLIKVGVFIVIFLWLHHNSNRLEIYWHDYQITTSLSVAFAVLTAVLIPLYILIRLWKNIIGLPQRMQERCELNTYKKGVKAVYSLIENIVLDGGNDPKSIVEILRRNKDLEGLASFAEGVEDPKTKILCLYLRAKSALEAQNWPLAYDTLCAIVDKRPESAWAFDNIIVVAKELHEPVMPHLDAGLKYKLIDKEAYNIEKARIIYHEALDDEPRDRIHKLAKAHDLHLANTQITVELAMCLVANGQVMDAKKCIKETWALVQTMDLAEQYTASLDPLAAYQAIKDLPHKNGQGLIINAAYAMKAQVWGEARGYLLQLEKQYGHTSQSYQLLAQLDLAEYGDKNKYTHWPEKALEQKTDR